MSEIEIEIEIEIIEHLKFCAPSTFSAVWVEEAQKRTVNSGAYSSEDVAVGMLFLTVPELQGVLVRKWAGEEVAIKITRKVSQGQMIL